MKKSKLLLSVLIISVASIIALTVPSCKDPSKKVPPVKVVEKINRIDKQLLVGNWLRTDAGYRILVSQVNDNGTLAARYFNPNPINVGKANWEENLGSLKIKVELRDINYPGSTYTLNYLPDRDMLAGEYFQAVEGLTFYVEFTCDK